MNSDKYPPAFASNLGVSDNLHFLLGLSVGESLAMNTGTPALAASVYVIAGQSAVDGSPDSALSAGDGSPDSTLSAVCSDVSMLDAFFRRITKWEDSGLPCTSHSPPSSASPSSKTT